MRLKPYQIEITRRALTSLAGDMEDLEKLADALNTGHEHVITLTGDAGRILADLESRGWRGKRARHETSPTAPDQLCMVP